MVESEKIKTHYTILMNVVEMEAKVNTSIWDYYNYLNEYKQKFLDPSNIHIKDELKEFLRGANRYSDEFSFSDEYYPEIRTVTNKLYDILNNESPQI